MMKKTLISLITTALLVLQSGTAFLVHAEDAPVMEIKTDAFSYCIGGKYVDKWGNDLENLTIENSKANFMVTAVFDRVDSQSGYKSYILLWLDTSGYRGKAERVLSTRGVPDDLNLKVGDLYYADIDTIFETDPLDIYVIESTFEYLGNGVDILGDEFADVVRHELILSSKLRNPDYYTLDPDRIPESVMKRGDVIDDGSLDIVDVVAVNKYVLGASSLDERAELSADVNCDLTVDATDSLMLLKEVIGLTTNFGET